MIKRYIIFLLLIVNLNSFSQGIISKFFKLSRPEKCWVMIHPFSAIKIMKYAEEARIVTDSLKNDPMLDGNLNGGQLDAFRHAYWMALISQKYRAPRARRLGEKHEKGNYLDYKKGRLEDGALPDSVACEMDLRNNDVGIRIGSQNKDASRKELIEIIKKEILLGNLWIIKTDPKGNFLSGDGNILQADDYKGKWINKRCLVSSN